MMGMGARQAYDSQQLQRKRTLTEDTHLNPNSNVQLFLKPTEPKSRTVASLNMPFLSFPPPSQVRGFSKERLVGAACCDDENGDTEATRGLASTVKLERRL